MRIILKKIPPELRYNKRCLIDMTTTPCTLEEIEICIKSFKNKATSDVTVKATGGFQGSKNK